MNRLYREFRSKFYLNQMKNINLSSNSCCNCINFFLYSTLGYRFNLKRFKTFKYINQAKQKLTRINKNNSICKALKKV